MSMSPSIDSEKFNKTLRTDDEFVEYISKNWFPGSNPADLEKALELYPSDPASGSPFDTGSSNAITPEYKRISAMQGDWSFQASRRQLLDRFSSHQTAYSFSECVLWPSYGVTYQFGNTSERTRECIGAGIREYPSLSLNRRSRLTHQLASRARSIFRIWTRRHDRLLHSVRQ